LTFSYEREIPDALLHIHGRGDYLADIRALTIDLDLETQVELTTDFLSARDLSSLIRSFDIGVVPYRRDVFTDGILPTKLLEYVALGVPAVVPRTTVISHYFSDDAVEFFNPNDIQDLARHICRLYRDKVRRSQLVRNAEQFNSLYNWSHQRDAYVKIVEQIAAR
jgi:glycosyltransferase involved in cell wall biosynthesis